MNLKMPSNNKLAAAIREYSDSNAVRFHMPGHKGRIKNDLLSSAARFDVTELAMTDDLNEPCGVIAFLETELAGIYSAKHSIMLVNGSTTGNIAMLASIGQSKRILLARDCHKSALAGAALAGHEVISLFPDPELSVITPESVEAALSESSFDAVFITSPTYYGQCCDVDAIADIVHAHGCKLFVDSAHGAHFPFSEQLPCSPVRSDAWVVSCHKTLPSFTQTAILNIGASNDIDPKEMQKYVSLIQSSSPSYILMLSVENCFSENICSDWEHHCIRITELRKRIATIPGLKLIHSSGSYDLTRLCISSSCTDGYSLAARLAAHNIYVEMADSECVVLVTTPNDTEQDYETLISALSLISKMNEADQQKQMYSSPAYYPSESAISIRDAILGQSEYVSLDLSVGRIAAAAVGAYPPGIAALFPGEYITEEAAAYLCDIVQRGAKLFGTDNGLIPVCVRK